MRFYEKQWDERLMCLRSDNGTEFVNKDVTRICTLNGIMHQRTVPYSPQQNGVAERMNRTIMENARSMLHYKSVPTEWWAEAVSTAVYLINRSTNTQHTSVTPYELGFKVKPTLEHLSMFGSHGYVHIDKAKRTKLEPKSFRCMFLGYAENVKGYRVFDLDASKVKVTRSVKLGEREVDGIYETLPARNGTVIHVTEDAHDAVTPASVERQPAVEEPMEGVEDDAPDVSMESVEPEQDPAPPLLLAEERPAPTGLELAPYRAPPTVFEDDRVVLHHPVHRSRRAREPVFLLEDGTKNGSQKEVMDHPLRSVPGLMRTVFSLKPFSRTLQALGTQWIFRRRTRRHCLVTTQRNGARPWMQSCSHMNGTALGHWCHGERPTLPSGAGGSLPRSVTSTVAWYATRHG
ncbi:hypothetical protein PR002_g31158 [Phytophthora rubi]|uniref:Integrase catalytic domain-containing protein n=1 Tax=Phytophthora rubi TaxID=129364 RepID=A0A6A3GFJ2_9STRA|nr:hypothetical protein PR002_g31158 [Phytophthora rubi]